MKNQKLKTVFFWIFTALLSFELVYGALWDFNVLNKGYVYDILRHLGYPLYLAVILGVMKLVAAVVILLPGFPLQKEWTYTGVVILFAGAFASHQFAGDSIGKSGFALGFAIIGILSWILRPAGRRLQTD
jgi:uncharacterized membrane protein YphA (DoxX/SURF4 family)